MAAPPSWKANPDPKGAVLMEEMSIFVDQMRTKALLHEYLRRLLVARPDDPVEFLINEIETNPFTPPAPVELPDPRTDAERARFVDTRPPPEQEALLREVFDQFAKGKDTVSRAELLVGFNERPGILLERFPKHLNEIPQALEAVECDSKNGRLTFEQFSAPLLSCLQVPGGR